MSTEKSSLIQPGYWYPCGTHLGSTDWMYVTSVKDGVVQGYNGSPSFWSWQTRTAKIILTRFEAFLPNGIKTALAENVAHLNRLKGIGWSEEDLSFITEDIEYLKLLSEGKVAGDQYLDDRMYFDVWVAPTRELKDGDPWDYLDSHTGGNCTTQRTSSDGEDQYEARAGIGSALDIEKDTKLKIVSVSLDFPQGADVFLSPEAKRLLSQYPVESESVSQGGRM